MNFTPIKSQRQNVSQELLQKFNTHGTKRKAQILFGSIEALELRGFKKFWSLISITYSNRVKTELQELFAIFHPDIQNGLIKQNSNNHSPQNNTNTSNDGVTKEPKVNSFSDKLSAFNKSIENCRHLMDNKGQSIATHFKITTIQKNNKKIIKFIFDNTTLYTKVFNTALMNKNELTSIERNELKEFSVFKVYKRKQQSIKLQNITNQLKHGYIYVDEKTNVIIERSWGECEKVKLKEIQDTSLYIQYRAANANCSYEELKKKISADMFNTLYRTNDNRFMFVAKNYDDQIFAIELKLKDQYQYGTTKFKAIFENMMVHKREFASISYAQIKNFFINTEDINPYIRYLRKNRKLINVPSVPSPDKPNGAYKKLTNISNTKNDDLSAVKLMVKNLVVVDCYYKSDINALNKLINSDATLKTSCIPQNLINNSILTPSKIKEFKNTPPISKKTFLELEDAKQLSFIGVIDCGNNNFYYCEGGQLTQLKPIDNQKTLLSIWDVLVAHENIFDIYYIAKRCKYSVDDYFNLNPTNSDIDKNKYLSIAQFEDIIKAINKLHAAGYILNDIKPENILIDQNGKLLLSDFDLAEDLSKKTNNIVAGTPYLFPQSIFTNFCTNFRAAQKSNELHLERQLKIKYDLYAAITTLIMAQNQKIIYFSESETPIIMNYINKFIETYVKAPDQNNFLNFLVDPFNNDAPNLETVINWHI